MHIRRDMTELSMIAKSDWTNDELKFYHQSFQQITPYLNAEGHSIQLEIINEIESRGGY
ncbi:cytosolic protein [Cytobacillus purgationiresistens]|nr:cytosolic protein [Cytobacillus purgationiresistens]